MREQTATSDRSWQIVAQKRRRAKTDDLLVPPVDDRYRFISPT
jgi:hypothetical protein